MNMRRVFYDNANALFLAAGLALNALGCGPANVEGQRNQRESSKNTSRYHLVSKVEVQQVAAGTAFDVTCWLSDNGTLVVPPVDVTVNVQPQPDSLVATEHGANVLIYQSGNYFMNCRSADGSIVEDSEGVVVEVHPSLPYSWDVELPNQECYAQNERLPINYNVLDEYGNVVEDILVRTTVIPDDDVTIEANGTIRFKKEGDYDVTVSLSGTVAEGRSFDDVAFSVRVDSTGPAVVFTNPQRGAVLQTGGFGDTWISVSGSASDNFSAITTLEVNEQPITISGTGFEESFTTNFLSRWGVSLLQARAIDACGNIGFAAQSFLRGPTYADAVSSLQGSKVHNALMAQINQPSLDDHDRSDLDDMVTLVNTVLAYKDSNEMLVPGEELITNPIRNDCNGVPFGPTWMDLGYSISRNPNPSIALIAEDVQVNYFNIVNGGLQFSASMGHVELPLRLHADAGSCTAGAGVFVSATVDTTIGFSSMSISGTIGLDYSNGAPHGAMQDLNVSLNGLYVNVDCGILESVCDLVTPSYVDEMINSLIQSFADSAKGLVATRFEERAGPMIEEKLSGFEMVKRKELDAPLSMALNVGVGLDQLTFCGPSVGLYTSTMCGDSSANPYARMSLYTQVYPDARGALIPNTARGPLVAGGTPPMFSATDYGFAIAFRDDFVNQLFWALWYGGAFDLDATDKISDNPTPGSRVTVHGMLPPVLMPGRDGRLFDIGVGDLYVDAHLDLNQLLETGGEPYFFDLRMYLSLTFGATIDIEPVDNMLMMAVEKDVQAVSEIVEISYPASNYRGFLSNLITEGIKHKISEDLEKGTESQELPKFDLSGKQGLPEGTVIRLVNAGFSHAGSYMMFNGTLGQ